MALDINVIILGILGIVGFQISTFTMFYFWTKRQEIKEKYRSKRSRASQKAKTKAPEGDNALGQFKQYLPLLRSLSGDQIEGLVEGLSGYQSAPGGSDILETILENVPPETIQAFLKGLGSKKNDQDENVELITPQV